MIALLCLLTAAPLAQQPAGLIRNGGFEEGPGTPAFLNLRGGSTALTGWVVTGEGIDLVGAGYWRSAEGTYAIDLDGSARSRTTPPHVRGGVAMRVSAAGQSADFVFDATGKTGRDMGWVPREWVFTAAADSTTLEFTSLTQSPETGYGAAVDRVAVVLLDDGPLRVTESEREIQVSLGGPTRPVAPNGTAEGRQQNRRVEVRLRK
jgi:hypothetical protein